MYKKFFCIFNSTPFNLDFKFSLIALKMDQKRTETSEFIYLEHTINSIYNINHTLICFIYCIETLELFINYVWLLLPTII